MAQQMILLWWRRTCPRTCKTTVFHILVWLWTSRMVLRVLGCVCAWTNDDLFVNPSLGRAGLIILSVQLNLQRPPTPKPVDHMRWHFTVIQSEKTWHISTLKQLFLSLNQTSSSFVCACVRVSFMHRHRMPYGSTMLLVLFALTYRRAPSVSWPITQWFWKINAVWSTDLSF